MKPVDPAEPVSALGPMVLVFAVRRALTTPVDINVLALAYAPEVAAAKPTPWIGLYERIAFSAYFVWLSVLSVGLWHRQPNGPREEAAGDRMQASATAPVTEALHWWVATSINQLRD